ncbi:MAG TPA: sulfite exporter TauE/SafE family protein [Beijerinckiaceae bacterium]|nr:sulfite exporter TauE/SafE family protein [Beijerinckiaceae bacterium]
MDGLALGLYIAATFAGGFTSGLTGFAAGLVVSGVWLHVITPLQTAVLIAAYGVVNQAYGILKVRHAVRWRRVLPFVVGGAIGVPLGAYLLTYVDPAHLRVGVGVLLILYSAYNLARPPLKPVTSNPPTDVAVGVLNGLLGGLTGLGGVISTIWVQLGGGPKDAQRAVFQPVLFLTMAMTTLTFAASGYLFDRHILWLFLLGLPALLIGLWIGVLAYGKLDDAAFRKAILVLLLVSGVSLVAPAMFR